MKILICGDVVGKAGRRAIEKYLPEIRKNLDLDFVVVNGENAAHGFGITDKICKVLYAAGVDVITTGNHIWDQREIMNYIGALAIDGRQFDYKTNERLHKALELKLFEDQKDTIKLTSLVSNVIDRETQEKIDIVKQRLIKNHGYNDESATDVLNFVASIFARGDITSEAS